MTHAPLADVFWFNLRKNEKHSPTTMYADRAISPTLFQGESQNSSHPDSSAGPATWVSRTGNRPMRIIWKLDHELPAGVFHAAKVATG